MSTQALRSRMLPPPATVQALPQRQHPAIARAI